MLSGSSKDAILLIIVSWRPYGQKDPIDVTSQWQDDQKSSSVVNFSLDLTNQGHCASCHKKCHCGKCQEMFHVSSSCPQTKLEGGWHTAASIGWKCCCSVVDVTWLVTHTITITTSKVVFFIGSCTAFLVHVCLLWYRRLPQLCIHYV